jgi:O-antigen/teichoic acid export membrane protein
MVVFPLMMLKTLLPIIPFRWNRKLFGEMIVYGVNFQINSISTMLYDPLTKALLSKFGGLFMVGFYEMANRMILQFRALIVNANQVLVPTIAHVCEKNPGYVQNIYRNSYRLLLYLLLPSFAGIIAFAPYISQIWIGHYEDVFVLFSILLALGWFINLLAAPTYFANLGTGELRWNTISHITIGALNGGLGFLFGSLYGGKAVVIAWVSSLILGSLLIPLSYHYRHNISLNELLPRESIMVILASVAGICTSLILYYQLYDTLNFFLLTFISVLVFIAILGFLTWQHPMRERLTLWLTSELLIKQREIKRKVG